VKNPLSRLALDGLTTLGDALDDLLTVLVKVKLGDDNLGGVKRNGNALAVALVADDLKPSKYPLH
jgi:hypothetical protein